MKIDHVVYRFDSHSKSLVDSYLAYRDWNLTYLARCLKLSRSQLYCVLNGRCTVSRDLINKFHNLGIMV